MTRFDHPIDVWNVGTFDDRLRAELDARADLIRDYMATSRRQGLERRASGHTLPYPENPHAGEFNSLQEWVMRLMERRTVRGWHYTRLTEEEVGALRVTGIHLWTPLKVQAVL